MLLSSVILRGTRGSQAAATAVPTGTLYYVTDEYVIERSNGTTWDSFSRVTPSHSSLTFTSDTSSQADSDPGNGKFKWNNATESSSTVLYFDNQTLDAVSLATFYASLGSSGMLYLEQADDATKWQMWKWTATPTNGTGYYKFTVTLQANSSGAIANSKTVLVVFMNGGGGSAITTKDEGSNLTTATASLDFVGAGVTATTSGNDVTITIPGGGSLVLLETHDASNSASLDFTSFISATYDEYMIVGSGLVLQTSTDDLRVEIGTGGGPTYDTGNNYEWAANGRGTDGTAFTDQGSSGIARVFKSVGTTAGWEGSFDLKAFNLRSTSLRKTIQGTAHFISSAPNSNFFTFGMQWVTTATAVSALRFIASSGNIVSGSIRIYGLAKT